jgi:phosphoserine aminotransferase
MMHNFNAGPSILPKEVFEEASRSIVISTTPVYPYLK